VVAWVENAHAARGYSRDDDDDDHDQINDDVIT
jgi:hypothetical protein